MLRKTLSAPGLFDVVKKCFEKIPSGHIPRSNIVLADCLMSGLAIFSLKIPSLLQFEHAKEEARIRHNLKSLFQINQAPSDTYLRERLDVIDPILIRKSFKKVFAQLQRGNALEQFSYLDTHSTYVAMSRHRESVDLFYGKDTFLTKEDLTKTLGRDRAKDITLDYLDKAGHKQDFAAARGVYHEEKENRSLENTKTYHNTVLTRDEERLIRQAKLKEFTESAKLERDARGTTKERSSVGSLRGIRSNDFNDFKRQFEAKNPERAASLQDSMRPEHEKKALSLIQEYKRLEQIVEKGGRSSPLAKDHLEKLADKMSRQKDVMQYVREHQKIQ